MSGNMPTGPGAAILQETLMEDNDEARRVANDFKKNPNCITQQLQSLEHVTLNIGVTGNSGSGKSTFVNAIRNVDIDDPTAAPTGATETTKFPKEYPHPTMPNVSIWDLPGIGTPNFKAKTYLSDVKFERYDFFIILTSERFKENDVNLAKAIRKNKKLFFFIRSKIDNDINAESRRRGFNEEQLLSRIREDCRKNLKCVGDPQVFLISSFQLEQYDFKRLIDTLEKELPENKKHALIQSLPAYSIEAIERKKKHFKRMIWLTAFGSGAIALVPIPGMTVACDYGIITSFYDSIFRSFGLQDKSLQTLAKRVTMNWMDLKGAMESRFKDGVTPQAVTSYLKTPAMASIMTLKALMSSVIPLAQLPAGVTSVAVMHYLLNQGLKAMEDDAKRVLRKARLHEM